MSVGTDDLGAFLAGSAAPLHNLALSLTGSHADADDLLQVTLEKVARVWGRRIDQPLSYARKAMVRSHISERRRAHWRRERVVVASELERVDAATDGPDERMALVQALRALPPRQREAVVLRYLEDLPVREVADLMGCSEGNVKRCAYDGLRALRSLLSPTHSEPTGAGGAR